MFEEFSEAVVRQVLIPALCNCLERTKGTMHSNVAKCKAANETHNAVTPVAQLIDWRVGLLIQRLWVRVPPGMNGLEIQSPSNIC